MKLLRALWAGFIITTPLLGMWLGSSLASYLGGPRWVAIAGGVLLFPVLPLGWELWAQRRRSKANAERKAKGKEPKKAWLTTSDRLTLRTLFVNLSFLTTLVLAFPQQTFPALSTRGAWFLDGETGDNVELARKVLFTAAEKLEWLYKLTHPNPYEGLGEGEDASKVKPDPRPDDKPDDKPDDTKRKPDAKKPNPDDTLPDVARKDPQAWPQSDKPHPLATSVPATALTSIQSLGMHFKRAAPDPVDRLRAMHDWVALNITYDYAGIRDGSYNDKQGASRVFKTRTGVCSGYSNLMVALGKVTGDRILYITGHTRGNDGQIQGSVGHAWNAVFVNGQWQLMDVTWDSPSAHGGKKPFPPLESTYFLPPPAVIGLDHFPDQPQWQLSSSPMSRGAFLRQPLVEPEFVAQGFNLVSPPTGRVDADRVAKVRLFNPQKRHVIAQVAPKGKTPKHCKVDARGKSVSIRCELGWTGRNIIQIFTSTKTVGNHGYVGSVIVN